MSRGPRGFVCLCLSVFLVCSPDRLRVGGAGERAPSVLGGPQAFSVSRDAGTVDGSEGDPRPSGVTSGAVAPRGAGGAAGSRRSPARPRREAHGGGGQGEGAGRPVSA